MITFIACILVRINLYSYKSLPKSKLIRIYGIFSNKVVKKMLKYASISQNNVLKCYKKVKM